MTRAHQYTGIDIGPFALAIFISCNLWLNISHAQTIMEPPSSPAQYQAACGFITEQREIVQKIVHARTGSSDKFVGETETGAREYQYTGPDTTIVYLISKDGKRIVRSVEFLRAYLTKNGLTEEVVADRLLLPRPLADKLHLGCDTDEFFVLKRSRSLDSMKISATFVD